MQDFHKTLRAFHISRELQKSYLIFVLTNYEELDDSFDISKKEMSRNNRLIQEFNSWSEEEIAAYNAGAPAEWVTAYRKGETF